MANSLVRIACRRHDWTQALFDQKAKSPSLRMEVIQKANPKTTSLFGDAAYADYAEAGLTGILRARAQGVPVKALPVFIRSAFRHSYIFVRTSSDIHAPKDLEGKRVGTAWGMTASLWAKGLLMHEYGVRLERIHWINREGSENYNLPAGMILEPVAENIDLEKWWLEGGLDALIHASVSATKFMARGGVKRLFDRAAEEERRYFKKTGIVPHMNVIACREETTVQHPDEVQEVFKVFCKAKEIGLEALHNNRHSGLFWYWEALEEQLALMGDDPVPYSVEENRHTLETFMTYAVEQGLVTKPMPIEDLFVTGLTSS
ncbi:MAG: ABC transporter substrate-binding protein [Nitrososphaerales archaeon]